MVMADPALIAGATGDGWIHDNHISGLEMSNLLSCIRHDRTAFMTYRVGKLYNLIPDSSLRIIMKIGSTDTHPDYFQQQVLGMSYRGSRLLNDLDLS
jgi:hypothetical protein